MIQPTTSQQASSRTVSDPCGRVAARLLEASALCPADHVILRENIATYLTQFRPEFVDALVDTPTSSLVSAVQRGFAERDCWRWTDKLRRDLENPYTDNQTFALVRDFDVQFKARVQNVLDRLPAGFPCKIYIVGGLAQRRFGANSDVDGMTNAPAEILGPQRPFSNERVHLTAQDGAPTLAAFGTHLEVDANAVVRNGNTLQTLVMEGLKSKGYQIETTAGGDVHIRPPQHSPLREREPIPREAGGVIWSFADLP